MWSAPRASTISWPRCPAPSSSNSRRRATPLPETTTTRSARSSSNSSTGRPTQLRGHIGTRNVLEFVGGHRTHHLLGPEPVDHRQYAARRDVGVTAPELPRGLTGPHNV